MKYLRACLLLFTGMFAVAQTPPGGLEGAALRTWLKDNWYTGKHSSLGYTQARVRMYNYIENHNNTITGVYGGYQKSWNYGGTGSNPAPINAEHTIPQSFFGKSEPMRSDIHHLFPTYDNFNSRRSNYPFQEIPDSSTTSWMLNTSVTTSIPSSNIDSYSEGTNSAFEPREDHKGNVARAVFYFYTMYPSYDLAQVGDINMFYQWHLDDPADAAEIARNDGIETYQGNRNPYVDHADWVALAWGFEPGGGGGSSALANGASQNFDLAQGEYVEYTIAVPANATDLVVTISGSGDADLYVKRAAINWPGDSGNHNEAEFQAPYETGSNESVTFASPAQDTWHVLVNGYSATTGSILATWNEGGPSSGLQNGVSQNYSVATGEQQEFTIDIPSGASNLVVTIAGDGDADLYVKRAAINWPADSGSHDEAEFKAPYEYGSNETTTFSTPAADRWHVLVDGYEASSGTIIASWD